MGTELKRVTDSTGRVIGVRKPGPLVLARALDWSKEGPESMTARLFAAAAMVVELDGDPVRVSKSSADLEAIVVMLDEPGLIAVQEAITEIMGASDDAAKEVAERAKN